jgi:hypothetical protein
LALKTARQRECRRKKAQTNLIEVFGFEMAKGDVVVYCREKGIICISMYWKEEGDNKVAPRR